MSTENKLFPGRENYSGPTSGCFGLLHHDQLYEQSHDVMERVSYVKRKKPREEIKVRLHNMIYLNPLLCPAILERDAFDADYEAKRDALYANYEAKCAPLYAEILAYIKREIPNCAWNGRELVFTAKKVPV